MVDDFVIMLIISASWTTGWLLIANAISEDDPTETSRNDLEDE